MPPKNFFGFCVMRLREHVHFTPCCCNSHDTSGCIGQLERRRNVTLGTIFSGDFMAFFLKDYKTMIEKSAIENEFQVLVVLSAVLERLLFLLQFMGVFGRSTSSGH